MPQQVDAEQVLRIAGMAYLWTELGREPTKEEIQELLGPAREAFHEGMNGGNNRRIRCWNVC